MTLAKTLVERPETTLGCLNSTGSDIPAKVFVTGSEDAIALPAATTCTAGASPGHASPCRERPHCLLRLSC